MVEKEIPTGFTRALVFGLLFIAVLLAVLLVSGNARADGKGCVSCHDDVWKASIKKRHVHPPFEGKQCERCHARDAKSDRFTESGEDITDGAKWVGRHFNPVKSHWFDFHSKGKEDTVIIEAKASGRSQVFRDFDLPFLDELDVSADNNQDPPLISNVRVLEVRRGIFLSATIGWDTDKPATSRVVYGLKSTNLSSPMDSQLTRDHRVTLTTGIKSKKHYQYAVISEDRYGNRAESAVFYLSTEKVFAVADGSRFGRGRGDDELRFDIKFFRNGDGYSVNIIASEPVTMALGIKKRRDDPGRRYGDAQVMKHIRTNTELATNISVCYSCHREYQEILTHPINVYPKRGMVIPPEYPTLSDGRITCMSCHINHGSDNEYRVIKPYKKALCVGCHRDMQ